MTTISDGTTAFTPVSVTGYATSHASRNVFHDILGRGDPDVSLGPASLRQGTLEMFFETETDANNARVILTQPAVFTYTDDDLTTTSMRFAISDTVAPALEDQTRELWTLSFGYRELAS